MKDGGRRLRPQLPDPPKLAVPAAGGAYRAWQHDIASREDKRKREREEAEINAQRIGSTTLTMGVKVGDGGKLYGSITAKDIADALGPPRHRGRPPQGRPGRAAQVPRHVQGRDPGPGRDDPRGHDRRRAQGLSASGEIMTTLAHRPNTALLVIDVQTGVVDGAHERDSVVANVASLVQKARREQVAVVWVQHSDDGLVRGSDSWRIVPDLTPGRGRATRREALRRLVRGHQPRDRPGRPRGWATRGCRRPD